MNSPEKPHDPDADTRAIVDKLTALVEVATKHPVAVAFTLGALVGAMFSGRVDRAVRTAAP